MEVATAAPQTSRFFGMFVSDLMVFVYGLSGLFNPEFGVCQNYNFL
jgi:hypothetical protein